MKRISAIFMAAGIVFDMGVIGIAVAIACDWVLRAVAFFLRLKSGNWNYNIHPENIVFLPKNSGHLR